MTKNPGRHHYTGVYDTILDLCTHEDGSLIGERGNSVYGMRAGSQGWKGEDGKAKTQWWERGMGIFPSPFLTTVFWPSHPPLSTLDFQPSCLKPNYLFLLFCPCEISQTVQWTRNGSTFNLVQMGLWFLLGQPAPEAGHKRVRVWLLQTINWGLISKLWTRALS